MTESPRDRIKREIGYGTGGLAEKLAEVDLVVTHSVPEEQPKEGEKADGTS